MKTKETIFTELQGIFIELFELDKDMITLDAGLYDDLDIDSIDVIDLVVKLKEVTGKKIQPEKFKKVRTVGDIVEAMYSFQNNAS